MSPTWETHGPQLGDAWTAIGGHAYRNWETLAYSMSTDSKRVLTVCSIAYILRLKQSLSADDGLYRGTGLIEKSLCAIGCSVDYADNRTGLSGKKEKDYANIIGKNYIPKAAVSYG